MKCPNCNVDLIQHELEDTSCSCHICAPCSKCTYDGMICPKCNELYFPNDFEDDLPKKPSEVKSSKSQYVPFWKRVQNIKDDSYEYELKSSGSWRLLEIYFGNELAKDKDKVNSIIRIKLGRPNGYSKYDMFKIKTRSKSEDGSLRITASICVD